VSNKIITTIIAGVLICAGIYLVKNSNKLYAINKNLTENNSRIGNFGQVGGGDYPGLSRFVSILMGVLMVITGVGLVVLVLFFSKE
jgi:hypothetical protein